MPANELCHFRVTFLFQTYFRTGTVKKQNSFSSQEIYITCFTGLTSSLPIRVHIIYEIFGNR